MLGIALSILALPLIALGAGAAPAHVLVIGIDGLGPIGIKEAETPHLDQLIAQGAHSFTARAVMPTSSAPNWASMIMGAGPEQHGIVANPPWLPKQERFDPVVTGPEGKQFPTMFAVMRAQRPDAVLAVVHDWDGFFTLLERKALDVLINGKGEEDTATQAVGVIAAHRPDLMFVHLDNVDHALHGEGFATPAYFAEVEKADRLVGELLDALDTAGIRDETLVIVTADHGGNGRSHGGNTNDEITIPWIVQGPGVPAGVDLSGVPINTFDTAATVLHVLGLEAPRAWIGRPVLEAFEAPR